jgi:AAA15 family ATPase/GTPase
MLIEFSVENFKCFAEKQTLDMRPDPDITSLDENLIHTGLVDEAGDELVLLPSVAIYGANASGKSSLLDAFMFFRLLISRKTPTRLSNLNFRFDKKEMISFECKFALPDTEWFNKAIITINYEFDCVANKFVKEQYHSYHYNDVTDQYQNSVVLERVNQEFKLDFSIFPSLEGVDHTQIKNFLSNVVSEGRSLASYDAKEIPFLKDVQHSGVLSYFTSLFIDMDSVVTTEIRRLEEGTEPLSAMLFKDEALKKKIIKGMQMADLSIADIHLQEQKNIDGRSVFQLLLFHNTNPAISFTLEEESSGTQLFLFLFASLIAFSEEESSFRYANDELETHLHPDLCRAIIELFNNPETNPKGSQLIFTTHNQDFMASSLMRPDQIYFVNKDQATGASEVYRASDFKEFDWHNYEVKVREFYEEGLLGANPNVNRLAGEA